MFCLRVQVFQKGTPMFILLKKWKNLYYEFARVLRSLGFTVYVIEHPLYIVVGKTQAQYVVQIIPSPLIIPRCVKYFALRRAENHIKKSNKCRSIREIYVPISFTLLLIKFCETWETVKMYKKT